MPPRFKNYELGTDISKETEFCSAFTVAELGEMFGNLMILGGFGTQSKHYSYKYFGFGNRVEKDFVADTEADARALMLINLIKNSLLDKREK